MFYWKEEVVVVNRKRGLREKECWKEEGIREGKKRIAEEGKRGRELRAI